jgi:YD repeat-containing protein
VSFASTDESDPTQALLAGNLSDNMYTAFNDLLGNNDNQHISTVYDAKGMARFSLQKQVIVDGQTVQTLSVVKESIYDNAGQLVKTIAYQTPLLSYGNNNTEQQILDALNAQNIRDDNRNRTTTLYYDEAGRLRFTLDAKGAITETRYNKAGQVLKSIAYEKGLTELEGLSINGLSFGVLNSYFVQNMVAAGDRTTTTTYDTAGRATAITDADNETEHFTYYANGLKSSYENKKGDTWFYQYDSAGRLTTELSPVVEQYGDSNSAQSVRLMTKVTYDGAGNVLTRGMGFGEANGLKTDGSPNVTEVASSFRTTTFAYDDANRQITVTETAVANAPASSSTITYNALGQAIVNRVSTVCQQ